MIRPKYFSLLIFSVALASPESMLPEMRLTPADVNARASRIAGSQIGSSKLAGVQTTVLYGDPSKAGFYKILL